MFRFDEGSTVYLHCDPMDFRLNINGLTVSVEQALGMDPFAQCVYVYSNRRRRHSTLGYVSPIQFEKAQEAQVGVYGTGSSPFFNSNKHHTPTTGRSRPKDRLN